MQGAAVNLDLSLDNWRCCRWSGEPMMPASAVCNLSPVSLEKQIREEEVWYLQKTLEDGILPFQDWLWAAERVAASPRSSQVSYADSKKELQKFLTLQKEVSNKVWPLESLNRQYHQLVCMGSISPHLRSSMQEINRRWEELQSRATLVSRRLQHFASQWEEFAQEKEAILVWLMDLDLWATDVEYSSGTLHEKRLQLQAFQQDVQTNAEHVDRLLVRAERLMQKSQPEDAELLEEELKELVGFHQAVFSRVLQFQQRLVSLRLVFEDEWESDPDTDLESDCFTEGRVPPAPAALVPEALLCCSTPRPAWCCRRPTPTGGSLTSDLEWDPSVDVGGSTSHDEDSSYCSAAVGFGQVESLHRRCRSLRRSCGRAEEPSVQSGFQGEWGPCGCPGADRMKTDISGHFAPQEPRAGQPPRTGGCRQHVEAAGFDAKRIETWLDQNCRHPMPEAKEDFVTHVEVLPPARELQIQTRKKKPQRCCKKKEKRNLITSQSLLEKEQWFSKKTLLNSQSAECRVTIEKECDPQLPSVISVQPQKLRRTSILCLLLTATFAVLAWLLARSSFLPPARHSCLQANAFAKSFQFMLTYKGPPPT